jgi:UDPglucose 6-dehydrogenase
MSDHLKISVFGLGKLGCTMLSCFAHKGCTVTGVDINDEFVTKINNGGSPIFEPGVAELISANQSRISATTSAEKAIMGSDISFVIVPTPSIEDGSFSTKFVEAVAAEIGSILRNKPEYHTVVITSTVLPGDMQNIVKLLEKTSGKTCGKAFGVCYNPDFIALGSIIRDFLNPDMILIGESDEKAGSILENIHKNLVENQPNIHRMNFHNAELTKIALNSYCTLKITFANTLAELCERLPGGDVDVVTQALGDDKRIGHKYLKGGLSYGGPCFPRDNRAFAFSAARFNCDAPLARVTDELNNYQKNERIPNKLLKMLKDVSGMRVSILGLTYKNDTTLVEESAAISVVRSLANKSIAISVYDPAGMEEAKTELAGIQNIQYAESAIDCIMGSDLCFIATPWEEFKKLEPKDFIGSMAKPVIFDAWNLYHFEHEGGIDYRRIGKANL